MTRAKDMKEYGIFGCPDWCEKPDDEHEFQQHQGAWRGFTNTDGDTVRVRPWAGWWDNGDDQVEVQIVVHEPEEVLTISAHGTIRLSLDDLAGMRELLDAAEKDISVYEVVEAYEGAEADEEAAGAAS
jgi:hypothetical protein